MKKTIIILSAFLLLSLCGCADKTAQKTKSTDSEKISFMDNGDSVFEIKTDYVSLYYPEKWKDSVDIKNTDGIVSFYALPSNTKLFDVLFDKNEGDQIGTILVDGKSVKVCVKTFSIDKDLENYDDLSSMQEDVNVILNKLVTENNLNTEFTVNEVIPDASDVFEIETPLTKLYFPTLWKNEVDISVKDNAVYFSKDQTKIFDLIFGGTDGDLLGTYNGTQIRVVLYEVEGNDLNGIQEGVNTIIEYLEKDSAFKAN